MVMKAVSKSPSGLREMAAELLQQLRLCVEQIRHALQCRHRHAISHFLLKQQKPLRERCGPEILETFIGCDDEGDVLRVGGRSRR